MSRGTASVLAALLSWSVPTVALAQERAYGAIDWAVGATTMLVAIALLVIAFGLSRVAAGSAMAENISYVVAACSCMGASVLASWAARFVDDGAAASQVLLGGQVLIIATMVLLCVYFYRVRAALKRFLDAASSSEVLARAQASGEDTVGVRDA